MLVKNIVFPVARFLLVRLHGAIGLQPFDNVTFTSLMDEDAMDYFVDDDIESGYHRMSIEYANADHYVHGRPASELPMPVQNLLKYLLNEFMPLGILSHKEIRGAEEMLDKIRERIRIAEEDSTDDEDNSLEEDEGLAEMSNKFYQMIPHVGGDKRRPIIQTEDICEAKEQFLRRFKSALNCLLGWKRSVINPLDYLCEKWFGTEFKPLEFDSDEFKLLNDCMQRTQHLNDCVRFNVDNIFEVIDSEANNNSESDIGNHRYLFHTTYANNLFGILKEGLLVAPQHVHSVNRFLGKGIYFWDSAAAALKIFRSDRFSEGVILVCRVAQGTVQEVPFMPFLKYGEEYPWTDGFDSLSLKGRKHFETKFKERILNGCNMYFGKLGRRSIDDDAKYDLYNRYLVKNEDQVRIDYLIKVRKVLN